MGWEFVTDIIIPPGTYQGSIAFKEPNQRLQLQFPQFPDNSVYRFGTLFWSMNEATAFGINAQMNRYFIGFNTTLVRLDNPDLNGSADFYVSSNFGKPLEVIFYRFDPALP